MKVRTKGLVGIGYHARVIDVETYGFHKPVCGVDVQFIKRARDAGAALLKGYPQNVIDDTITFGNLSLAYRANVRRIRLDLPGQGHKTGRQAHKEASW